MKKAILLVLSCFMILSFGCQAGKTLEDPTLQENGKRLSYGLSLDETHTYDQKSERSFYFNFEGNGFAPREIINGKVSMTVVEFDENTAIHYSMDEQLAQIMFDAALKPKREKLPDLDFAFTVLVNPAHFYGTSTNLDLKYSAKDFHIEPYNTKLEGTEFDLVMNNETGNVIKTAGLDEIPAGDLAMNKAKEIEVDYGVIMYPYLPTEPIKPGDKWSKDLGTKFETYYGTKMSISTKVDYELVDFVEYKGHKCGFIKLKSKIQVENFGKVDDFMGTKYDLVSNGNGDGRGEIYFSFDGYIIDAKYDWIIDFDFELKNDEINAVYNDVYSAKRTEEFELIK